MAYAKLPKVAQDYGLGYQTVNQAADNEQALRDILQLEHGGSTGGGFAQQLAIEGHHSSVLIPRAIALVEVSTVTLFTGPLVSATFALRSQLGGVIPAAGLQRLGKGEYFVGLAGVDPSTTWAEPTPEGDGAVIRQANVRFVTGGFGTGAFVRLLERSATTGKFELADYSFSLAVFSR